MSDAPNVASEAGGDATPVLEEKLPAAVADKSLLTNGGDAVDTPAASDAPDWRAAFGADPALTKQLQRFASPEAFAKSYRELQGKLSAGQQAVPALPEDATPEEMASHRKALGIPEKPEDYKIEFPKEIETTEAHTAVLTAFQERMHAKFITPDAAKEAFQFYVEQLTASSEAQEAATEARVGENMAQLREYFPGREFRRNFGVPNDPSRRGIVGEFFDKTFSKEVRQAIGRARLPDGVPLSDYAPFLKEFADHAHAIADDGTLEAGDAAIGGKSDEDEYKELIAKPRLTASEHKRALEIAERRHAREQRQGRSRAA